MGMKRWLRAAVLLACGVALPMAFHLAGAAGPIFLPMHIPVLMAGLLLGARLGLVVGVLTPVLSSLMTGMPPIYPVLPMMTVELGLYGLTSGLLRGRCHRGIFVALIGAMIAGRLGTALVLACFAQMLGITAPPLAYVGYALARGTIGVILQLVFIPVLVRRIERVWGKR